MQQRLQDGNNLLLKLKDGNVIVIENLFTIYDDVKSDLVFAGDDCTLYWFDGTSGFHGISGLEVWWCFKKYADIK